MFLVGTRFIAIGLRARSGVLHGACCVLLSSPIACGVALDSSSRVFFSRELGLATMAGVMERVLAAKPELQRCIDEYFAGDMPPEV